MIATGEYYLNMSRCFKLAVFAAAIALPLGAGAQGPPASVTSPGFGGNKITGVPASVTSPGFGKTSNPFQRQCCFNSTLPQPPVRHHHRFPNFPVSAPVYAVPYYVPVEVPVDDTMEQVSPQPNEYLGGPTIFDRRGQGTPAPEPVRRPEPRAEVAAEKPASAQQPEPPPAADRPETLLIFKDGHQLKVQNYAIVGETLYDMTPGHRRKVAIAELDITATTKQNDELGIDFRLPPAKAN